MATHVGSKQIEQYKMTFMGYKRDDVERAVSKITSHSGRHKVSIDGRATRASMKDVEGHPGLLGCDAKGMMAKFLHVSGDLDDVKNLIRTDTPRGVLIELLPRKIEEAGRVRRALKAAVAGQKLRRQGSL